MSDTPWFLQQVTLLALGSSMRGTLCSVKSSWEVEAELEAGVNLGGSGKEGG